MAQLDTTRANAAPSPSSPVTVLLSNRDRAVLRAVAEGRGVVSGECGNPLTIDGFCCADQFACSRLRRAGLISMLGPAPAPAVLTQAAQTLLAA